MSAWESVEFELARILAALIGQPDDPRIIQFYGSGRIFQDRLNFVKIAADHHFMVSPNQDFEGDFELLAQDLTLAADRRNEVAHSVVYDVAGSNYLTGKARPAAKGVASYVMLPPFYAYKRHTTGGPTFAYSSKEAIKLARQILSLQMRARPFRHRLYPKLWPTERREP